MSSESSVFHHLPCFNTDHLSLQSTPESLPRLGVPSIVTGVFRCACLASSPTPGVLYSAAVLPPFCSCSSPVLAEVLSIISPFSAPKRYRPAIAASADLLQNTTRPSRTTVDPLKLQQKPARTGLIHLSCCACCSAESPSPALCTFVAPDCSNLSLSSSSCALSHDRRDTPSHRPGF